MARIIPRAPYAEHKYASPMAIMEAAVFDTAVKLVEKFTDLLKFRHERRREFFTSTLEPLFKDMEVMHSDYLQMFDACREQLTNASVPLRDIADSLAKNRRQFETLRIKVRAFVEALKESSLDDAFKNFLLAAADVVPDGDLVVRYSHSTKSNSLLKSVQDAIALQDTEIVTNRDKREFEARTRQVLIKIVAGGCEDLRKHWSWICVHYARANAWSLK